MALVWMNKIKDQSHVKEKSKTYINRREKFWKAHEEING